MQSSTEQTSLKKAHYERASVVSNYEKFRFGGRAGAWIRATEEAAITALLANVPPAAVALDVPTGTGRMIPVIRPRCRRIIASDISATMVENSARYGADEYLVGDAAALALPAACADLVLSSRFIFHFEDLDPFFRETARLLRPGGHYLFDAYNWTPRTWIPGKQRWLAGRVYNHPAPVIHGYARKHGFTVVAAQGTFALTPFIYQFMPFPFVRFLEKYAGPILPRSKTKTYYLLRKDAAAGNPDLKTG